ncbi:TetR/AcrR family transcriptional regulator [Allokutzneria albata]|uniref:Regulatory protein, tetR family n=1 Tax=Allokutzneria albata TaxID=211114 RepID=A0A1G9TSP3_ALLAB|nr:TetR/AcrR family transcriptional regulator [Allokutzneria albata]SDM50727.1 regulatory protein, tetR family [Allokutzneria albata]
MAEVIWSRPERTQPHLSRSKITAAAIALADERGVDALSMRQLAAELGCGTMSLYRHVRTKDELLDLMVDAVVGEGRADLRPTGDWRADLRRIAHAEREVALRHPWVPRLMATRSFLGPNVVAAIESALSSVDGRGLGTAEMVRVIDTVTAFVHGFQNSLPRLEDVHYLKSLVDSGEHPRFARMVEESDSHSDRDAAFEWQLERVLDGLATVLG